MKKSYLLGAVAAALLTTIGVTPAHAKGAEIMPEGAAFYLADSTRTTVAETTFTMNSTGDSILVGDFTGTGRDTIAVRSGHSFTFSDGTQMSYGRPTDEVFVGDWNGDGRDTLALRRGNVFHVANSLGGAADAEVPYGRAGDTVYVGDWDGNGVDTVMVRRGNANYFKNTFTAGYADHFSGYGRPEDQVFIGDWNGDRIDTVMVRRGNTNYLKNDFSGGAADIVVDYGRATDTLIIGNWTGAGATLGVIRSGAVPTTVSAAVGTLPAPRALVGAPVNQSPVRIGNDGWFDRVLPPSSVGYEFTSISATADFTAGFYLRSARGMTVQLQRSTDGGRNWQVVDSAVPATNQEMVDLTIPATRRMMTADYRLAVPAQRGYGPTYGPTSRLTHYLASALPHSDTRRPISDIVGPYCQNTPISYDGSVDGWLYGQGDTAVSGLAYSLPSMDLYEIVLADRVRRDYNVWGDPWVTHLALHECGHVVAFKILGERYDAALNQAYPQSLLDRMGTDRHEAVANALAYHWAKYNPGGNRTQAFRPTDAQGRTWMDRLRQEGMQPWRTWVMDYRQDDALIASLTREAMMLK